MSKKLLSMLLCIAMVLSLTVISVSAEDDLVTTVVFNDDFAKNGAKSIQSGALSDKWSIGQAYGSGINVFYSIYDGFLGMSYRWNQPDAKVYPTGDAIASLGAENEISYKMAYFGGYAGETGVAYGNSNWASASTVYSRFNVSEDGTSYFEIGKTGYDTAVSRYLLPTSDENGTPIKDDSGAVVNGTTRDYTNRFYFRKVVNGETTYIRWENDENGWFADKANYGDGPFKSWAQSAVFYQSADNPVLSSYNKWFTVNIKNTATGVEYSVTAKNLGNDNMYTWSGSLADTSLSRKGAGLYFGCKGHEAGAAIDDFSITEKREVPATVAFSDDFSTDGAKSIQSATALSDKWTVGNAYGSGIPIWYSIYDGFLGVSYRWNHPDAKVYPTGNAITYLPAKNEISYKMAYFGGYYDESTFTSNNNNWASTSTVYSRFNVSEDGTSYFEIGKTGGEAAITRYLLPTSDENGTPIKDDSGAVVNATTGDYATRFYFRKVVNGETTYIRWENDENGWFASKASYSDGPYRMWSQSAVHYKSDKSGDFYTNNWFTVNIKNTSSGVEYSVTAKNLGNSNMYTWTGSLADTSLSRKGAGIYFGCKGHEVGMAIDDVTINSVVTAEMLEPNFKYDFTKCTADNCTAMSEANKAVSNRGCPTLITWDNETGAKWYLSSIINGVATTDERLGWAYFAGANSGMAVRDVWQNYTALNLDLDVHDMQMLSVSSASLGDARNGIRFLVSEDEHTFYEFMCGRYSDGYSEDKIGLAVQRYTPYFRKVVTNPDTGKVTESYVYCPEYWGASGISNFTWTVLFKDATTLELKAASGDKTWTYTYTDTELSSMIKNAAYPVALASRGDAAANFYNVSISGTLEEKVLKDNGETVTVTVQEGLYDYTDYITAVVAYYDEAGNMLIADGLTFTGNTLSETYTKPEGTADVKAFLFDGDPIDGKLLNKNEYDGRERATSDPKVVAVIGDSLTEGHGVAGYSQFKFSYPGQLQRELGGNYVVKNFGKGSRSVCDKIEGSENFKYTEYVGKYAGNGASTDESSIYADSLACNPDIVVMMLGTNDRSYINDAAKQAEFKEAYTAMIDDYQALETNPEIYIVLPPIADNGTNTTIKTYMYPILQEIAKEQDVNLVDMHLAGPQKADTNIWSDSVHFSVKGYRLIAEAVSKAITSDYDYVKYTDNAITIKPTSSIEGAVYAAFYNADGGLVDTVIADSSFVLPNADYTIDISGIDKTDVASVKLMAFADGSLKPLVKYSKNISNAVTAADGKVTVAGKTALPNESNVVVAADANGVIAYINSGLSDYDANYKYSFEADVAEVYVNGVKLN